MPTEDSMKLILGLVPFALALVGCGGADDTVTDEQSFALLAGSYQIRTIPPLPGATASYGYAINDSGAVVGSSTVPGGTNTHAIRQLPGSAPRDLGTLPGGNSSTALAINATNHVVGGCYINSLYSH